ncbi:phage integrase N-terminal SAM-like domain-containing protein [Saccharopolyspora sp. NFXS83]|uniref:tyrosine-type recombinase/integrase n=1 Tax=Saccharopolyspora sp. NFXS83 TaxID=2993560 RepID=UPI00224B244D|nr:phage integrase N-terminal SAM-like domain-containing protein [Saccharopolyspora sp. NFXS83]MCX2729396.1 phage integrase N-terminal SAM-like domain-containing protein [Saccharopolyspora sp. NFXS83]
MREQWDGLIRDYGKALKRENKSPKTIELYVSTATWFADWLAKQDRLGDIADVTRADIGDWITELLETRKPATANGRFRALQQWFHFLVDEDEITESPMQRMKPPQIPEVLVPVVPLATVKALLKQCEGKDLISRRDAGIIRLLIDTCGRLSEVAGLKADDLDLEQGQVLGHDEGDAGHEVVPGGTEKDTARPPPVKSGTPTPPPAASTGMRSSRSTTQNNAVNCRSCSSIPHDYSWVG